MFTFKGFTRILLGAASAAVLATAAHAADAVVYEQPPEAIIEPGFTWTGLYIGANAGYSWGDFDQSAEGEWSSSGLSRWISTPTSTASPVARRSGITGRSTISFSAWKPTSRQQTLMEQARSPFVSCPGNPGYRGQHRTRLVCHSAPAGRLRPHRAPVDLRHRRLCLRQDDQHRQLPGKLDHHLGIQHPSPRPAQAGRPAAAPNMRSPTTGPSRPNIFTPILATRTS